jgi:hypothetical protein
MFQFLQVLTLVLVATTLTFALAHVAEWPGKLRLDKDAYLTVQTIYYPGFTIGGISEPVSMLALLVLTISTPRESPAFGWTLAALASMTAMHLIFWLVTQPVNKVWLRDQEMAGAGTIFFNRSQNMPHAAKAADWTALRDRWEYSHIARAVFAMLGLICLAIAMTSRAA